MDLISTTCIHDIDGIHYLKILLILFSINDGHHVKMLQRHE